jgi:hypothetical protein
LESTVKAMNACKHRHRNRATRGWSRLEPKWHAVESGLSNVARRELTGLPVYQSEPKLSRIKCRTWKGRGSGPRRSGSPNRKAGKRRRHGEDRRSQSRCVMHRIRPRRSGLEWQESMRNRFKPGKANDERRLSLGASRSCRPQEHSPNGHIPVLPSCPSRLCCHHGMERGYRATEDAATGNFIERPEPCEGKLSCTVLRGAWASNRLRLPGVP